MQTLQPDNHHHDVDETLDPGIVIYLDLNLAPPKSHTVGLHILARLNFGYLAHSKIFTAFYFSY